MRCCNYRLPRILNEANFLPYLPAFMNPDPTNTVFQQAVSFVNETNKHLFLTGKAGTGKTTFLKYIKQHTFKRLAVVAPTGVAAINAGGVTIHSFFQLPFGPFIPGYHNYWNSYEGELNNPSTLIKNLRLPSAKRDVLRELDLLIIDEVSMVRADMLDAIDTVLRHVRRQPLMPFGGVQMVYIGDLFQLPPVIKNEEWNLLKNFYQSPFFFHADVIKHAFPLYIELRNIYRQKDDSFIHILNNIRNNTCDADDLEYLHQYYKPGFQPQKEENYITLTSHNGKADVINETELQRLPAKARTYQATITGDFQERSYPAEKILQLKVGAQVMFIKNDKGEIRRFYNGKIATISKLEEDKVKVTFADEPGELELERETWKNIRYKYQQEKDHVDEEELGTFTQFPIRLAWAITIHKSQGLTFEKAIIDAGASFAPGQVYVSLSRLTSLEGLILYSRILPHTISTDQRVIEFVQNEMGEEQLQQTLQEEQKTFVRHSLSSSFAWEKITELVEQHYDEYAHRKIPQQQQAMEWAHSLVAQVKAQNEVAVKFKRVLEQLFINCEADKYQLLFTRTKDAANYFLKEIDEHLLGTTNTHVKAVNKLEKVKKYQKELQSLLLLFERKKQQVQHAVQLAEALHASVKLSDVLQLVSAHQKPVETLPGTIIKPKATKPEKGTTQKISLHLFKEGKCIADIATERNLSTGTIEGHLASFISTGEIDVLDLISPERLEIILRVIESIDGLPKDDAHQSKSGSAPETIIKETSPGHISAIAIKESLPPDFSYGEIKAANVFYQWQNGLRKDF